MRRAWPREPAGSPASVRTYQPAIAAVQRSATALGAEAAAEARWQGRGSEATLAGILPNGLNQPLTTPATLILCKRANAALLPN
jgi:hypothetical protein